MSSWIHVHPSWRNHFWIRVGRAEGVNGLDRTDVGFTVTEDEARKLHEELGQRLAELEATRERGGEK